MDTYNSKKYFRGKSLLILSITFLIKAVPVYAQDSLSVFNDTEGTSLSKYEVNGYFRGGLFANEDLIRDKYAEGALKLNITGNQYGNAYTEIRYKASENNNEKNGFQLREGYVNLYLGKFDFRIGRQIVLWGRADGFNPVNNITPADFTVFSPDEDDKRLSNFVVRSTSNFYPFKLELDWVPVYKASVLPFANATLPAGISWGEGHIPDTEWKNSSFGIKLDFENPAFDGSLSYFNGYHKMPGLNYNLTTTGANVFTRPWQVQVFGFDFSTTTGNLGLRGEFAYTLPDDDTDSLFSIPRRQLEYTLGIDREWGNFSLIVQYVGKYIFDLNEENSLQSALARETNRWNQMLFGQQEKWNHSISIRPSVNLLHETLKCEMLGLAGFSTEEWFVMPEATYIISDALTFCIGAQLFNGPNNTLYGFISDSRNAGFAELKISF